MSQGARPVRAIPKMPARAHRRTAAPRRRRRAARAPWRGEIRNRHHIYHPWPASVMPRRQNEALPEVQIAASSWRARAPATAPTRPAVAANGVAPRTCRQRPETSCCGRHRRHRGCGPRRARARAVAVLPGQPARPVPVPARPSAAGGELQHGASVRVSTMTGVSLVHLKHLYRYKVTNKNIPHTSMDYMYDLCMI